MGIFAKTKPEEPKLLAQRLADATAEAERQEARANAAEANVSALTDEKAALSLSIEERVQEISDLNKQLDAAKARAEAAEADAAAKATQIQGLDEKVQGLESTVAKQAGILSLEQFKHLGAAALPGAETPAPEAAAEAHGDGGTERTGLDRTIQAWRKPHGKRRAT